MSADAGFPLPVPPHWFNVGDRVRYVLEQVDGTVLNVSTERGNLGLPYCEVAWDDAAWDPDVLASSWVLMQHLWPSGVSASRDTE